MLRSLTIVVSCLLLPVSSQSSSNPLSSSPTSSRTAESSAPLVSNPENVVSLEETADVSFLLSEFFAPSVELLSRAMPPNLSSVPRSLLWPKVSSNIAAYNPLPLPVSGTCHAGTQYVVNSVADLYGLIPEIECVWTQGIVPNKVPMGAAYGRLLAFANTAFYDYFVEFIYQGDYLLQTQCNGNYYNIGILNFGGFDLSTGVWTISPLPDHYVIMDGEHYDGRAGVLMDFTIKVETYCPKEGNESGWKAPLLEGFSPFRSGGWPVRLFIDMLRAVGRDADECIIMLGRTWMLNPTPGDNTLYTSLYFTLRTCDSGVLPALVRGTKLDPIPETYTYNRAGLFEVLNRLNPISYALGEIAGTYPDGMYDYKTYGNTNDQPPATGGPSTAGSKYPSSFWSVQPEVAFWELLGGAKTAAEKAGSSGV
eukprot:GHVQ01004512.1.p1 GENE.GHVQ01004512.1~~GHVQ01004512.1.p1  ORF type:complete len:423 (+),score=37.27 GHVQ01004512.1:197-1465(+)